MNMQNAQDLQDALDTAITAIVNIGRRAHKEGDGNVTGMAFTASELLREGLAEVATLVKLRADAKEAAKVPFDKPAGEKRKRKPRAAKASAKTDAPDPRQTTIANGHPLAPAGAE